MSDDISFWYEAMHLSVFLWISPRFESKNGCIGTYSEWRGGGEGMAGAYRNGFQ